MEGRARVATEALRYFETFTRDGDETIHYKTTNDRPEWVYEMCFDAHGRGDMLPDDYRYEYIYDALTMLTEAYDDADAGEIETQIAADVYNSDLTDWLTSHALRAGYCDEAAEEMGVGAGSGTMERIALGQWWERNEVFRTVVRAVEDRLEEEEDEEEDEDE